ncbi:GNAT family N-acetyltransferase [Litorisediminicola beolgyonensis]|uniref:GNAT family N-acetyltransferase n=1 Tax=Litorisediminicola beolgyonensis TaxID=1173614 RepID=A0ABW3ZD11_9RHOB
MSVVNGFGQPVGAPVETALPAKRPERSTLTGRFCRVEPLVPAHADALYDAFAEDAEGRDWTYLPLSPPESREDFAAWMDEAAASPDPLFFTICDAAGPAGHASYLRITPDAGVIEVGYIHLAPRLQRTAAATEAMALMMQHAIETLGYRRYEWKCDALNAPSRRAAARLGFTYEGTFRQASVVKGRNRDTAWFSVLDSEWPSLKARFQAWLSPENFDAEGRQRTALAPAG